MSSDDVQAELQRAGSWDFDALAFVGLPNVAGKPITVLGCYLEGTESLITDLVDEGFLEERQPFFNAFQNFMGHLDCLYRREALYHGPAHAVDVMSTLMWCLNSEFFRTWTSAPERFMCLIAAAAHDVGHPGRNNNFYTQTALMQLEGRDHLPPLALRYHDKSILENYHVALAFETMQGDAAANWFRLLPKNFRPKTGPKYSAAGDNSQLPGVDVQKFVRRGLIEMVLHTDNANHNKFQSDLIAFGANHVEAREQGDATPVLELEDKFLLLGSALHAVDTSNPCKPHNIMLSWCKCFLQECWNQGDLETDLGVAVSPLCDRQKGMQDVPGGQLGFVAFIVEPYWRALTVVLPEMQVAMDQLAENKSFWTEKKKESTSYDAIFDELGS